MRHAHILLAALALTLVACGESVSERDPGPGPHDQSQESQALPEAEIGTLDPAPEHTVAADEPYGPIVREADPAEEAAAAAPDMSGS